MKKTLFTLALISSSVFAGGYSIMEYSATNLGRSFAGAGVNGDDYSAIAFNPAGMVLLGSGLQANIHGVFLDTEVKGTLSSKFGNDRTANSGIYNQAYLPSFFGQKAYGNWRFGLGIYSPLGLEITYQDPSWGGSAHAISSKIVSLDFVPAVAYQVNRYLSLGAGVYLEYLSAELTNTVRSAYSQLLADGIAFGANVGAMFQPFSKTKVGISYRTQNVNHLEGKHTLYGINRKNARAHLAAPAQLFISLSQGINDRLNVMFSAKWTKWDCFSMLNIRSDLLDKPIIVPEKWRNVWMFAGGLDYRLFENWTTRLGFAFDQTPVSSADYRTARIPDSNHLMLTAGLGYRYNHFQIDLAYAHLFFNEAKINNTNGLSTLKANADMQSNVVALSLQYHF